MDFTHILRDSQCTKFISVITSTHPDTVYTSIVKITGPHWNFTCPLWLLPAFGRWADVNIMHCLIAQLSGVYMPFPHIAQIYVPFNVKREKMENFMCLLKFECATRLKAHSQAIPVSFRMYIPFTHILQGYFTGTGAIIRLPQCRWSNSEEYGSMYHTNPWHKACNGSGSILPISFRITSLALGQS